MSKLSDLAARLEQWTHTKSGQWPTRSMDDDFNEAAAALREAEQALLKAADLIESEYCSHDGPHGNRPECYADFIRALIG